jgi:hypothetical protein
MTDLARGDTALRNNPDVIEKRLDKATVLVNMSTNRIFELNETGGRVWELLGQGFDADRIVSHLVDEFDVDDIRATDEVKNLLMRLRTEGLLTS